MKTIAGKVMHKRFVTGVIMVLILLLPMMPLYPRDAVYAFQSDSGLWEVEVSTIYTKAEGGDITDFDTGYVVSKLDGTAIQLERSAGETAGYSGQQEKGNDGDAVHSITVTSTTVLKITSKGESTTFSGSANGTGKLYVSFEDGANVILFAYAGTGYAKAAALLKAEGDLNYQDKEGLSVGDVAAELGGGIAPGGIGISYAPKEGEGSEAGTLTGNSILLPTSKQTFNATFKSYAQVNTKADDSDCGIAQSDGNIEISHEANITGKTTSGSLASELTLEMKDGVIVLKVKTVDEEEGATVEDITKRFTSKTAEYTHFPNSPPAIDQGWGSPAKEWVNPGPGGSLQFGGMPLPPDTKAVSTSAISFSPAGSSELGVKVGDWAEYSLSATVDGLENITSLKFAVTQVDKQNGWLLLLLSTKYKDGTMSDTLIRSNVFTGEGEIRGIVLPSKANVGDNLYNVGTITGIESETVGAKLREVAEVSYKDGATTASATYDRITGLLIKFDGVSLLGSAKMVAINSSLHSPTPEECQSEITDLKYTLGQTQQQLGLLQKTLEDETQKYREADAAVDSLRLENDGLTSQLQLLRIALILGATIALVIALILVFYLRRITKRLSKENYEASS